MSDAQSYQKISKTFKQIVDTITIKQLAQVKLYFTNMGKLIAAGGDKFFSEFHDVKNLLDNVKEAKGKLAIHFAVASGRLEIVEYLVKTLKLDHQVKDKEGNTPFFTAVEHGHTHLVRYFNEELNVSIHSTKEGEISALHVAANHNDVEMIKFLLGKGCDIEKVSIYGKPINWAVGSKSEDAIKYLLQQGADANGDLTCPAPSPLILAVDFDQEEIYHALLNAAKPASITVKDPQGYSLLHLAAEKGNLKLVKQFIEKGLPPNEETHGKTPLTLAFENSKWEVVSYLKNFTQNYEALEKKLTQQKQKRQTAAVTVDKEKADLIKNDGNKFFMEKKYAQALQRYKEALVYDPANDAIHRNLAACYLNLNQFQQALEHCHQAKIADPKNVKNLYREAQAFIGLNNLVEAASTLWQCSMLEPETPFFRQQFQKYMELAKKQHQGK